MEWSQYFGAKQVFQLPSNKSKVDYVDVNKSTWKMIHVAFLPAT